MRFVLLNISILIFSLTFIFTNGQRRTPGELGVPECVSNYDCVIGGFCIKDRTGKGRCFCSSSCPLSVPVQCLEHNQRGCVTMGEEYTKKYDMRNPLCYHKRCICPPTFDPLPVYPPIPGFEEYLSRKCDRRQLDVQIAASPSSSLYKGTMANLFCCINVDPRGFIRENDVYFLQNGTRRREPSVSPYGSFSSDIDTLFTVPTCWVLFINNVQPSDAGTYTCNVQPLSTKYSSVNATMEFEIKIPRIVQNILISPNSTTAEIRWDYQPGSMLRIDLDLYRRSDRKTRVWNKVDASPPVLIEGLQSATPYTLFLNVKDGNMDSLTLTEQFQTLDGLPDPPFLEDIRVVNGGVGQKFCEIEWRPPRRMRGHIARYYVQITGRVRYVPLDSARNLDTLEDYPTGIDECSNYNQNDVNYINPLLFQNFYACKYGPLKPNRDYSATIWAENKAGRSIPVTFREQCLTDFAEPNHIYPPELLSKPNISSFGLGFGLLPDETNGPISCYYLAILPLPLNISLDILPSPDQIVMDNFDKALQNNLHYLASQNNRFFAYVAESYVNLPKKTVVGDGQTSGAGSEPCSVLYLTRYKPLDSALPPQLKYTGFLIARVDRDRSLQMGARSFSTDRHFLKRRSITKLPLEKINQPKTSSHFVNFFSRQRSGTIRRQLTNQDPAYGFSPYFDPLILQNNSGDDGAFYIVLLIILLILFISLTTAAIFYFLYKKKYLKNLCPLKKNHDLLWPSPPEPIRADDLPVEYILRHRDSDYHFTQEFEMLPRGKNLDHTISERKENSRKNRYNDIKACDSTRVRLRKPNNDPNTSDYINANFIKGYKSRKMFIATQGPLESTIADFWRMIWEQGSRLIIMVTNLRERGREQCAKYWPDEDEPPLIFRSLDVRAIESVYHADYTIREFELSSDEMIGNAPESVVTRFADDCSPLTRPSSPQLDYETKNLSTNVSSLLSKHAQNSMVHHSSVYSLHSRSSETGDRDHRRDRSYPNNLTITSAQKVIPEYANISSIILPTFSNNKRHSDLIEKPREKRRVLQYHFTCWHDYKAPECTIALLRLICKLRKMEEYTTAPIVIHCSAGVGRTGTLMAIDYVMDQCREEGKADVFSCVSEMRQQRNLMVQSVEQYVFIYKALAEYQLFGDTDFTTTEFLLHITKLRQPYRERHHSVGSARSASAISGDTIISERLNPSTSSSQKTTTSTSKGFIARFRLVRNGAVTHQLANHQTSNSNSNNNRPPMTYLEHEFNNLSIELERQKSTDWAQREENACKNRYPDAVPYNSNRVLLMPLIGYENTYINASLIKGYFYPYILAQDPVDPTTAFDFWRMVNDNISYTLVMLSSEQDFKTQEMYWPREVSKRLVLGKSGELIVTLSEEAIQQSFVQRKLHYRFKSEKGTSGRDIVQYSIRPSLSGSSILKAKAELCDLIGRVLERQSNIPDAGPIVLHCRDGSLENGLFCCVSMLLERYKSEQMIDVFRTVKSLQLQRHQIITQIDHYAFCYDCISEYLTNSSRG